MAFKTLFLAYAPDADKDKTRGVIETPKYILYAVVVKNLKEALDVTAGLYKEKGIESIILCPGFTHADIAEIVKCTENKVGVTVARGDGPSGRISSEAMKRAGFF